MIHTIIGTASGIINQNLEVSIYLDFGPSVFTFSSISLGINYDPSLVTCIGFSNIDERISDPIVNSGTNSARLSWFDPSFATFSGTISLFGLEFQGLVLGQHSLQFELSDPQVSEYTDENDQVYSSPSWTDGWVNFDPIPSTTTTSTTTQVAPITTLPPNQPSSDTYAGGNKQFATTYGSKPMGLKIPIQPRTRSRRFFRG